MQAAAEHGARFLGSNVLHIGPDVRQAFFGFLEREYPDLVDGYRRLYPGKYAARPYQARVQERVRAARAAAGFDDALRHRPAPPSEAAQQLALPGLPPPGG